MVLDIKENELLSNHSTFRIGGAAKYFVVVKSKGEILEAIKFAKNKNLPYFVFGMGSNILFRDEGFKGVAIKITNYELRITNYGIVASAGVLLSQIIMAATEAGLTGLEWGIGIPGTVGGCVVGNCGAFGKNISESIERIKTLDKEYSKEECEFTYRESKFKKFLKADLDKKNTRPLSEIILEIELELEKGNPEEIKEQIKNNLAQRKDRIPSHPSIGCIFKNPPPATQVSLLALRASKPLSAGKLIEECGLKGQRVGDAQISDLHANIIVNLGNAKAQDVLELIKLCKQKVKEKFKLDLKEEIVIL